MQQPVAYQPADYAPRGTGYSKSGSAGQLRPCLAQERSAASIRLCSKNFLRIQGWKFRSRRLIVCNRRRRKILFDQNFCDRRIKRFFIQLARLRLHCFPLQWSMKRFVISIRHLTTITFTDTQKRGCPNSDQQSRSQFLKQQSCLPDYVTFASHKANP